MKAENFDRKFDDGENIIEYLDLTKIKRSNSSNSHFETILRCFSDLEIR